MVAADQTIDGRRTSEMIPARANRICRVKPRWPVTIRISRVNGVSTFAGSSTVSWKVSGGTYLKADVVVGRGSRSPTRSLATSCSQVRQTSSEVQGSPSWEASSSSGVEPSRELATEAKSGETRKYRSGPSWMIHGASGARGSTTVTPAARRGLWGSGPTRSRTCGPPALRSPGVPLTAPLLFMRS